MDMSRKLNSILLIDDNEFDNYYHEKVIQNNNIAENIVIKSSGADAIAYLKSLTADAFPELILLDINMPGMNGWDVLDEYEKMGISGDRTKVIMLTTSIDPDDEKKARSYAFVFDFIIKPLSDETLIESISKYF